VARVSPGRAAPRVSLRASPLCGEVGAGVVEGVLCGEGAQSFPRALR